MISQRLLKYCLVLRQSSSTKLITVHWRNFKVIPHRNQTDRLFNSIRQHSYLISSEQCDSILQRLSETNDVSSTVFAPLEICNLPKACIEWKKETKFVESRIFQNWLTALEANFGHVASYLIIRALKSVRMVYQKTNVNVECMFSADLIIKFTETCFRSISTSATTQLHISRLLDLLQFLIFIDRKPLSSDQELLIRTNLLNSFFELTEKLFVNPEKCFLYCIDSKQVEKNYGKVLFRLAVLGMEPPSDDCKRKIIEIYSKSFGSYRGSTDFSYSYLLDVDAFVQAFLIWNINADLLEENFWAKFIAEIPRHFPFIRSNLEGRAVFLRTVLHLAIEYDQEKEFNKMKFLWLDNLRLVKSYFSDDNAKYLSNKMRKRFLLDKMNKKYFAQDESKPNVVDEFGFQPIKTLLESL